MPSPEDRLNKIEEFVSDLIDLFKVVARHEPGRAQLPKRIREFEERWSELRKGS